MDLFRIDVCRSVAGCKKAVTDVTDLIKNIEEVFWETDFNNKRKEILGENFKQHYLFKVGIAGCPNGCSQPQIKDFALMAKVRPILNKELCNLCGVCVKACREEGLSLDEGKLNFKETRCLGCGDCWRVCAKGAIKPGKLQWRLLLGGKLGRHPQLAEEIREASEIEVKNYLRKAIVIMLNAHWPDKRFADLLALSGFK